MESVLPLLFQPLELKHLTLKNRVVLSPMCQYSSMDGFLNYWHVMHLGKYAAAGVGVVMQEATAVTPEGRISYWDAGIWKDAHVAKMMELTNFITNIGAIPGIQLAHAGRKGSDHRPWEGRGQFSPQDMYGWQTVAPSSIPYSELYNQPDELSIDEIEQLVQSFGEAARRSVEAGYKIIEIHAAHGYLIHQFLSPLTNKRTDDYGGNFTNRIRFLMEIVESVKMELKRHSLWVRISATDWAEGGWDLDQSVQLVQHLKNAGVEVVDVSSGGAVKEQKIEVGPGYQVPFAKEIKAQTEITTAAVGMITTGEQAELILQNGEADLICIGRALLRNPHWVYEQAKLMGYDIDWVPQYRRAKNI